MIRDYVKKRLGKNCSNEAVKRIANLIQTLKNLPVCESASVGVGSSINEECNRIAKDFHLDSDIVDKIVFDYLKTERSIKAAADVGIIGGSGFYDPNFLENTKEVSIVSPYGRPSDVITIGELEGWNVAFLPRHGRLHTIRPTDINYRANIDVMKQLGVKRIIAPCTCGSLNEDYHPGDVVFVDQFIDRTTRREQSFYGENRVCHISVAEPICSELRRILYKSSSSIEDKHGKGTYVCVEGPRFSTRAESRLFRSWKADVVGMTLVPECVLAREAEMCYASIAMVTDYDVWKKDLVSASKVSEVMKSNIRKVKYIITEAMKNMPKERKCECKNALEGALLK